MISMTRTVLVRLLAALEGAKAGCQAGEGRPRPRHQSLARSGGCTRPAQKIAPENSSRTRCPGSEYLLRTRQSRTNEKAAASSPAAASNPQRDRSAPWTETTYHRSNFFASVFPMSQKPAACFGNTDLNTISTASAITGLGTRKTPGRELSPAPPRVIRAARFDTTADECVWPLPEWPSSS